MHDKYLLMNLQDRFKKGGYALVAPNSGRVYAYGEDIKIMHNKILKNNIPTGTKEVMFIPRKDVKYIV